MPPVPTPSKDSGHHGKCMELCMLAGSMEYQQDQIKEKHCTRKLFGIPLNKTSAYAGMSPNRSAPSLQFLEKIKPFGALHIGIPIVRHTYVNM